MIEALIDQARSEITGELSDRSRITDHLLDIRQAAGDIPAMVIEADRLLGELPGLTIVPNAWWTAALDDLQARAGTIALDRGEGDGAGVEAGGGERTGSSRGWTPLDVAEWTVPSLPRRRRSS